MGGAEPLSAATEDYLKAIYALELDGGVAVPGEIGKRMGVRQPSVTAMLRSLARRRLIRYQRYHGARLTEGGRVAALRVIRRHRLAECFLTDTLRVPWQDVHVESELLEHAISERLAEWMDVALGHPSADPHGHLIPAPDGSLPSRDVVALDLLDAGVSSRVAEIDDRDPELLKYLQGVGIVPGAVVVSRGREPYGGAVLVELDGETVRLGSTAAGRVRVAGSGARRSGKRAVAKRSTR